MKVIDLLQRIANGEEVPRKVKHKKLYWEYNEKNKDFKDNEDDWVFSCSNYDLVDMLNDEVEIIEEDKKIEHYYFSVFQDERLGGRQVVESLESKINEIIDYINGGINENTRN